jgi:hypothetical protein
MSCEVDSSFSLTPNFSWVPVNHQSVATVSTVLRLVDVAKLLKQFGNSRSTDHPSEEGVNDMASL